MPHFCPDSSIFAVAMHDALTILGTPYLEQKDQIPPFSCLDFKGKNGDYLA